MRAIWLAGLRGWEVQVRPARSSLPSSRANPLTSLVVVDAVTSVLSQTHEILKAMLPAGTMLESSAICLELLGIASALFRCDSFLSDCAI